jgi:hypothetical protein
MYFSVEKKYFFKVLIKIYFNELVFIFFTASRLLGCPGLLSERRKTSSKGRSCKMVQKYFYIPLFSNDFIDKEFLFIVRKAIPDLLMLFYERFDQHFLSPD